MSKAQYKTKQMTEILTYLKSVQGHHVTVNDIRRHFQEQGIAVGTTTVYRQLDKMVKEGIVAKYVVDEKAVPALNILADRTKVIIVITVNVRNVES